MPIIRFANPARDMAKVSDYSLSVLKDIMSVAGISHILITSTARTPSEQARIMFENIERHGVDHQKRLYGPFGDRVIDRYSELNASGKTRDDIISGMTSRINMLGPGNVSRHVGDPDVLNVVDIAPSSVPVPQRESFERAVRADARVLKLLTPPADPAYHLEIPQPGAGAE